MNRNVAIVTSLAAVCAISILFLGCPPPVVRVRSPEPRVEVYGTPSYPEAVWIEVIGGIREGNGSGFRAIGRGGRSPMPIGSLAVGNQEMGVGSGSRAIGSTDKRVESGELRVKNLSPITQNS